MVGRRRITRREFLQASLLSLGAFSSLAFRSFLPKDDRVPLFGYGRVTGDAIRVRAQPSLRGKKIGWRRKDEIIPLLEQIVSPDGPLHNPRWYRIVGGYIHSAYIQIVQTQLNYPVLTNLPEKGQLAEVTVPYTRAMRPTHSQGWQKLYRLYYRSMHWVTGIDQGPDGKTWYQLTDDLLGVKYYVRATHLRPVPAEEVSPLSPDVPADEKRIVVSLPDQTVTCYEGDQAVFHTEVSTGAGGPTDNGIPRITPSGRFRIAWKMPVRHMGDGELTNDIYAYELPGVPWCSFFVSTGVAFHGTYWHDNFGTPMSSGCVNMRPDEAKWLFRWTLPENGPQAWFAEGAGTVVDVIE